MRVESRAATLYHEAGSREAGSAGLDAMRLAVPAAVASAGRGDPA
jgi:hypothetical protein